MIVCLSFTAFTSLIKRKQFLPLGSVRDYQTKSKPLHEIREEKERKQTDECIGRWREIVKTAQMTEDDREREKKKESD